jgi:hypothetical protein
MKRIPYLLYNVLMANLFLVTDFSFDSYVYLCLFSLQLIVVQIQIDSPYFLKTEIAETVFGLKFISLKSTFIY